MPRKRLPSETRIISDVERVLTQSIPPAWSLKTKFEALPRGERIDLLIEVTAPDGKTARFAIKVKRSIEPRSVPMVAEQISILATSTMPETIPVVAAAYLSPRTRELLDDFDVGYIDTTGNIDIVSSTPGLFVCTQGASSDPGHKTLTFSRFEVAVQHGQSERSSTPLHRSGPASWQAPQAHQPPPCLACSNFWNARP